MDVDQDGVITRKEWRGNARAFDRQDTNRDGVLSGSEIWPAGYARGRSAAAQPAELENPLAQAFLSSDHDRDGIISRAEWPSDPATFARVDANGDGVVTRPEYLGEGWTALETTDTGTGLRRDSRAYQSGYDRGLTDGRQAGKEDKQYRNQWDLEGQRELEQADAGYQSGMGTRADYQAGYRAGFRAGYRQGFGPRL